MERERGNDSQAFVYAESALLSAQKKGDIHTIGISQMIVCELLARTGEMLEAQRRMQAQLERGRQENDWRLLLPTLDVLGEIAYDRKDWPKAYAYWLELLPMVRIHQTEALPNLLRNLAVCVCEMQDYTTAWQFLEQSVTASRRNRFTEREGWARRVMAEVAFRQGNLMVALEHLHLSYTIFQDIEEVRTAALCLCKAARFHIDEGRYEQAALLLGSVERRLREQALALTGMYQKYYDDLVIELRNILGEEAWQAASERGQTLAFEEVETLAFAPEAV